VADSLYAKPILTGVHSTTFGFSSGIAVEKSSYDYLGPPTRVRVKPLVGDSKVLEVPPCCTVQDLAVIVEAEFGVPVALQVLAVDGRRLVDADATLEAAKLYNGAEVTMLEKPMRKLVIRAWDGRCCHELPSSVPNGEHLQREMDLWVPATVTIGEVKRHIKDHWPHYKVEEMSLHLNQGGIGDATWREPDGRGALPDETMLESLKLREEGFLCVAMRSPRRIQILFPDGYSLELTAPYDCSEHELRRLVTALPGVPAFARKYETLRLVLKPGTYIGNSSLRTLGDLNVQDGATIYCLPVEGRCLGRPLTICTAKCGPYTCECRQRDVRRLPDLDEWLDDTPLVTEWVVEEVPSQTRTVLSRSWRLKDRAEGSWFCRMLPTWGHGVEASVRVPRTSGLAWFEPPDEVDVSVSCTWRGAARGRASAGLAVVPVMLG